MALKVCIGGEWNEETKEKYGIDDNDELSKLKAFRETSYTLPKGSAVRRFTSRTEAEEGTDLSRPFYASKTEHDYNVYAEESKKGTLPAGRELDGSRKLIQENGLVKMSTVDDMVIARGSFVTNQLFHTSSLNSKFDLEEDPGNVFSSTVLTSPEVRDHFRKLGYDAIEDITDQRLLKISKSPIIVLNGKKMKIDEGLTYDREHPPSWDD